MASTHQQIAGGRAPHPYSTILCPIEFDESSLGALKHARQLAAAAEATLLLLHVVPIIPSAGEIVSSLERGADAPAQQRLGKLAQRELADVKHEIRTKLALGSDVAREIVAAAREAKADLIVMATHGRAGVAHFLLGSVTEAVVRHAPCPVLTVRS